MRQALFLCAAPKGFLLQTIPQRAVQPLGTPCQRSGYRGLADPQLLCDVRDPFALGEVHPQQLPLPGRQLLLHRQGQIHQQTPDLLAVVLLLSLLPQLQAGISSGS